MNFFDISSVCIIWATEKTHKIWNDLLKNMSSFSWDLYGVNPKWGSFKNIQFYTDIDSLPTIPDIAVFAIPAALVWESLKQCGKKWITRAIIISAGFKEIWNIQWEEELQKIAKKYNIQLLGPNCLWYIDTSKHINLSFWGKEIKTWNIAMVSQSGAMAVAFTDWAYDYGVGFSKIISMWNKAGIWENDLLQELAEDSKTEVIALYLESIEQGKKFYESVRNISKKKPIVIIKSGMSDKWSKAAASHTWALASSTDVLLCVFEKWWLHYTNRLEEFFLWSQAFSHTRNIEIPEEIVVVTNAGWPGVMTTDHADFHHVWFAEFNKTEKQLLMQGLPDAASVKNPIDIIGDATSVRYGQILKNIASLQRNMGIFILLTPQTTTDIDTITDIIIDFHRNHPDTLICTSFMGAHSLGDNPEKLERCGVLNYDTPQKWISVFSKLIEQKKWEKASFENDPKGTNLVKPSMTSEIGQEIEKEKENWKTICSVGITQKILKCYDIPHPIEYLVTNRQELEEVLSHISYPIVEKISSPHIPHKTEIWAVKIWIPDHNSAIETYENILENVHKHTPDATVDGVIITQQIEPLEEIFVWCKRDSNFWDLLILWKGGIYVDVYKDIKKVLLPINTQEIIWLINGLTIAPILHGARWKTQIDIEKLAGAIYKISQVFKDFPQIQEIDINPIQVNGDGIYVIDTKLYI